MFHWQWRRALFLKLHLAVVAFPTNIVWWTNTCSKLGGHDGLQDALEVSPLCCRNWTQELSACKSQAIFDRIHSFWSPPKHQHNTVSDKPSIHITVFLNPNGPCMIKCRCPWRTTMILFINANPSRTMLACDRKITRPECGRAQLLMDMCVTCFVIIKFLVMPWQCKAGIAIHNLKAINLSTEKC